MSNKANLVRSFFGRIRALMDRQKAPQLFIALFGSLLVLLTALLALSPTRYKLSVGMVPHVTITAIRDVVDEITTEQNRSLAAAAVTPTYRHQEEVTDQVVAALEDAINQLSAVRQYAQTLPDYSQTRHYTDEELSYASQMLTLVKLRDYQLVTLMNAPQAQFDELVLALRPAVRNTMQGYVTQGQEGIAINSIMQIVGFKTNVNLLQNVVMPTLKAVIVPNMVIDKEQTDAAREAAMKAVEPVVYKQGQNIVARGEGRIKNTQIAMLTSLGLLQDNKTDGRLYWGAFLIVALTLAAFYGWLAVSSPSVIESPRRLALLYVVLLLITLISFLARTLQGIYLTPVVLGAMLISVTLGFRPALILNACSAVIAALILGQSGGAAPLDLISILVSGFLAGTAAAALLSSKVQRMQIFLAGAVAVLVSFLTVMALGLMYNNSMNDPLEKSLYAAGGAALSMALCLALQPLLESLFNLPTYNRLMELSNPNHPLMRRLLLEAPGTYHHSIMIANLAEAAAEAVGANPLLARVGGYYHDIGKLKRPLYFKENQIGSGNVHDSTDPSVSAAIITSHIRDGLAMARQFRLPREVQQIISQHHGNSRVAYFYTKALKEAKEAVDDEDFRYDGVPPESAEASIVMICDTVEAAVRTLTTPSPEELSAFIGKLIKGKQDDGQLQNSPLSLHDLHLIKESCVRVVYGIFHERIEYPGYESNARIGQALRGIRGVIPPPAPKPDEKEAPKA